MEIQSKNLKIITENKENEYYILLLENSIGKLIMASGSILNYIKNNSNIFFVNDHLDIFSNLYNIRGYSYSDFNFLNINESNILPITINNLLDTETNISSIYNFIFNEQLEYE